MTDMKAVRVHQWGGPEAVAIDQIAHPEPAADEILIRVRAAGVNPVDWKTRRGWVANVPPLPITLGWDLAGDIVTVGEQVQGFHEGDAVLGMLRLRGGAFAEYAVAKVDEVALKPASIDYLQAASLPLAALSAWQAVVEHAQVSAGQHVLIHGAAGGIGMFAVQLARLHGAFVVGTASAANESFVRELGAAEFIDYRASRFEEVAPEVDVVIDNIGGETLERSYQVIKPGGVVVSLSSSVAVDKTAALGIRAVPMGTHLNSAQLAEIVRLFNVGKLKTYISHVLPLDEVRTALELSERGHTRGKIVLNLV